MTKWYIKNGLLSKQSVFCDPAGAQTQNLQNRNLTLYSIELRGPERPPDGTGGAASA